MIFEKIGGNFVTCQDKQLPDINYWINVSDADGTGHRQVVINLQPSMYLRTYSGTGGPHDICTPNIMELAVPEVMSVSEQADVHVQSSLAVPSRSRAAMLGSVF